jgi:hypothetical protein
MNFISIHIKCCHIKYIYIQLVTVVWLTDKKFTWKTYHAVFSNLKLQGTIF